MNEHQPSHFARAVSPARGWADGMAVHEVFRVVAERFADRVAVVCGNDRLTYRELDGWSDEIACALIDGGLRIEDRVALAVPKSAGQIAAILGTLKAGGAYVPLVANQPIERLRAMVSDSGCTVALTVEGYLDEALIAPVQRFDPADYRSGARRPPPRDVSPRNLAYIMYTSGSTGQPKGAMIEHDGVVRLVHNQDYMPFGPEFNFLYGGPLSFDLSTIEIYTPLLHGSTLIISDADILTPEMIRRCVSEHQLSGICVSFSLFRALFNADAGAFERIPVIGVCGEPADPNFIRRAQERLPGAQFYNAYGPTECTALSTTHQIARPCPPVPAIVPIGIPLARMSVRVVDEAGRSVPMGEIGELRIGGVGLARGYLNDPALTDAKFVLDAETGRREYKSGDLVRVGSDGVIEYLGRADDQVKIRGQRIELGEVDAALNSDPDVVSAASVVVGSGEDARIAACLEVVAGASTDRIRDRLKSRLTSAMMPSVLVPVAKLPINRNGKADRQAIKALVTDFHASRQRNASQPEQPLSLAEQSLSALCGQVLGGGKVDLDKSFVENGGNSLRAMMLRMSLRRDFGIELSVPDILRVSSLGELSGLLSGVPALGDQASDGSGPHDGEIEVSSGQARLWMVQQLDPSLAQYNIAYRITVPHDVNRAALDAAWSSIFERHPALRTVFRAREDGTVGAELLSCVQALPEWKRGACSESVLRDEATRPFNLSTTPLARLVLWPEQARGLLVVHHIVTDAWSMEVILRDLAFMYVRHRDGTQLQLPDPGPGAPGYAIQRKMIEKDSHTQELAQWLADQLRSRPATRAFIRSDLANSWQASSSSIELDAELRVRLNEYAARQDGTPHSVLMAAFAAWSATFCGTQEPTIGMAVSTRDEGSFAESVGFFVETVPVPFSLKGLTFGQLVAQTRRLMTETHDCRLIPFDHLVRLVGQTDQPGRTPITDVFFNYIDRSPISGMELADEVFSPDYMEFEHGLARFDLLGTVYRSESSYRVVVTARKGDWTSTADPPSADGFAAYLRGALEAESVPVTPPQMSIPVVGDSTKNPEHAAVYSSSDPTHDHLVWTIAGIFKRILGRATFGPDDDFFASGGDSLKALRAFAAVRERFPTELTTSTMFRDSTPRKLATRLREEAPSVTPEAFLQITEPGRSCQGYILPGVTGDILSMRRLVDGLGPSWSCRAAMYPGVNTPRPPFDSIGDMLDYYQQAILPDYDACSSALIGYSFGGILGYELAVRLQQQGHAPALLVIIDAHLLKKYPVRFKPVPVGLHVRNLLAMDRQGRRNYLLKRADAIKRRVHKLVRKPQGYDELPEVRRLTFANLRVVRDYQPSDRYAGRVLIVQGYRPDWMHTLEDDGANGWRRWLTHEPTVVSLKASHVNLIKSDAVLDVASMVRQVFDHARSQAG